MRREILLLCSYLCTVLLLPISNHRLENICASTASVLGKMHRSKEKESHTRCQYTTKSKKSVIFVESIFYFRALLCVVHFASEILLSVPSFVIKENVCAIQVYGCVISTPKRSQKLAHGAWR